MPLEEMCRRKGVGVERALGRKALQVDVLQKVFVLMELTRPKGT